MRILLRSLDRSRNAKHTIACIGLVRLLGTEALQRDEGRHRLHRTLVEGEQIGRCT